MDFLKELGISDNVVKGLYEIYDEEAIDLILSNELNIIDSIVFLKKIGVNNIEKILLYKMPLFFWGDKKLKKIMERNNNLSIEVDRINNDYKYVDVLYNCLLMNEN